MVRHMTAKSSTGKKNKTLQKIIIIKNINSITDLKKNGTDEDEVYNSTSTGTVPYSRACMYNISQVLTDEKKIYVTKTGFEKR